MDKYPSPVVADEEIDTFIEWLSQKETINRESIRLVIDTIMTLQRDRTILQDQVTELANKASQSDWSQT